MKSGKVLCYMFLVAILRLDPAECWKVQKMVMCAPTTNQQKHCIAFVIHA